MTISFFSRDVYGRVLHYPTGEGADHICSLIRMKTITKEQMQHFESLGVTFTRVDDPKHSAL